MPSSTEKPPQEQLQREFRLSHGVKRLLSMTGVSSLAESLTDEASWLRQQWQADHETIYGGSAGTNGTARTDAAMRDMIAGDVVNNIAPKRSGPGLMTTALLAGATGVGGALLWDKLDDEPAPVPAAEQPDFTDTDTRTDVQFPD